MADKTTFIKIDRNIKRWRWYKDANTFQVFFELLLEANIADNGFKNVTIHRGETVTSYKSISAAVGLTYAQARTAIQHLKETGEITVKNYSKFLVVSILNYDRYQSVPHAKTQANNNQMTGRAQSNDRQMTGKSQHLKNIRNKEEKNSACAREILPSAQGDTGDDGRRPPTPEDMRR